MFSRFRSSARRSPVQPGLDQDQSEVGAMLGDLSLTFPPMQPLHPPAAGNDDLRQRVYEAVEHELRAAGYLS